MNPAGRTLDWPSGAVIVMSTAPAGWCGTTAFRTDEERNCTPEHRAAPTKHMSPLWKLRPVKTASVSVADGPAPGVTERTARTRADLTEAGGLSQRLDGVCAGLRRTPMSREYRFWEARGLSPALRPSTHVEGLAGQALLPPISAATAARV